jgi:hypothetical protein
MPPIAPATISGNTKDSGGSGGGSGSGSWGKNPVLVEQGKGMGQLGSMSAIRLSDQDRRLARIPPEATHQLW